MPTKVFCILDGFGLAPQSPHNAFSPDTAPYIYNLFKTRPWLMLDADGDAVGQETGLVGNSEVGHTNLGGLQLVPQLSYQITHSAANVYNQLSTNQIFSPIAELSRRNIDTVHLVGLFSTGTIHSDLRHWLGSILAADQSGAQNIVLHLISDGRDSNRQSLVATWAQFTTQFATELAPVTSKLCLGSLGGRYYAMDRDNNQDRIDQYLTALYFRDLSRAVDWASVSPTLQQAATNAYGEGIYDETMLPHNYGAVISPGDAIWLVNFRADRMKQLVRSLVDYNHAKNHGNFIISNNNYGLDSEFLLNSTQNNVLNNQNHVYYPIFSTQRVQNTFNDYCHSYQNTVLHLAETEKYAHVTYFFTGGRKNPSPTEEFHIIPSHKVESHAERPEMRAVEITDYILQHGLGHYDYIVVNYANADMVGHTGNIQASRRAIQTLDTQLKRLIEAIEASGGSLLLTADHGNVESVGDTPEGGYDTEHNANSVPCILVSPSFDADEVATRAQDIITRHSLEFDQYPTPHRALTQAVANQTGLEEWFNDYTPTYPLWVAGLLVLSL